MKKTKKEDVTAVLEKATLEELMQVGDFLDEHEWDDTLKAKKFDAATRKLLLEDSDEEVLQEEATDEMLKKLCRKKAAGSLADSLWWEYQTFLGFVVRSPSYDEITKTVMKRLGVGGAYKETRDCWDNQSRLCVHLVDQLIDAVPAEQKADAIKELLGETDAKKIEKEVGTSLAKLAGGGGAIWVSRLSYPILRNVLLRLVHGVARTLLGRGLSFAAAKTVLKVVAKRTALVGLLAGPVGWLLTIWGLNDLTGTNYKKVLPAMLFIYVIHLRLEQETETA